MKFSGSRILTIIVCFVLCCATVLSFAGCKEENVEPTAAPTEVPTAAPTATPEPTGTPEPTAPTVTAGGLPQLQLDDQYLLIDADFTTGSADDLASGMTLFVAGNPTFKEDADLGKTVAVLDASFSDAFGYLMEGSEDGAPTILTEISDALTLELYVKIDASQVNAGAYAILGASCHQSGFAIWATDNDNKVNYDCHDGTSYAEATGSIYQKDKWVHIVAVSDGNKNSIYVDGKLVGSTDRADAEIKPFVGTQPGLTVYPDGKICWIGGNIYSAGGTEILTWANTNMSIAYFRMYNAAATADEIAAVNV